MIVVSLVSTASILPFSVALPMKCTYLKLSWRNMNMLPFLLIMSAIQIYTSKSNLIANLKQKGIVKLVI